MRKQFECQGAENKKGEKDKMAEIFVQQDKLDVMVDYWLLVGEAMHAACFHAHSS